MSYFRFSVGCGEEWTRTTELRRGQIYSLLQLPLCDFPIFMFPVVCLGFFRADEGTRTPDRLITNQLLYQLSYIGFFSFVKQLSVFLIWGCKDTTFFSSRKFFFSFSSNYFLLHWLSYIFFHPSHHPFTLCGTVFCPFMPSFTPILGYAIRHPAWIIVLFFVNQ